MKNFAIVAALSFFAMIGCNNADRSSNTAGNDSVNTTGAVDDTASTKKARAEITATKADTTGGGTADFTITGDNKVELKLTINFPKMANKSVAAHFHEHGDCGDSGKEAHGHWNPTQEKHGKWGEGEYHSGDIGNIQLDGEGKGQVTISSDRWSIGGDEKTNIVNKAIIVHSGVDDYKSQPSGNSGSRIGCGVIQQVGG